MSRRILLPTVILAGCFSPTTTPGSGEASSTDTSGPTSSTTQPVDTTDTTDTTGPSTSLTTTDPTDTTDPDTTADETGPAPACDGGLVCLEVPDGWVGPFAAEFGDDGQCDDASFPSYFAGTAAAWDDECTCDCAGTTGQTCTVQVLGGGDAASCGDNDEVLGTCTFDLPSGPMDCDSVDGCYEAEQALSAASFRECNPGQGNVLHPGFTSGYRLCNPDAAIGSPCDGGQCGDAAQALCIVTEGEAEACPPSFPNQLAAHQGFAQDEVACECACVDPADCAYLTWYDGATCGVGGGDDDPPCSPQNGLVRALEFVEAAAGCEPALARPVEPEFGLDQAITLCCTIGL